MDDVTRDALFSGRLMIDQPAAGYRFSIDAVILANTAFSKPGSRVCDIGTGCGIVPIVMAYRNPGISIIYGVELQERLAEIAAHNVAENRMEKCIKIIRGDAKTITPDDTNGTVDLLVCNPPHYGQNAARINPLSEKAVARHEISLTLDELVTAAGRLLSPGGRFMIIYPATRITDLAARLRGERIEPKWLRFVHTAPGNDAKRVIIEGIAGGGPGAKIADPLFIMDGNGRYSPEVEAMYAQ